MSKSDQTNHHKFSDQGLHNVSGNPQMRTFANSEDLNEMQHNAAFHLGLHSL